MNHLDSDIQDYPDDDVDDIYADDDDLIAPIDERWRPVAVIAGIVFVLAVIATVVIVNGGDSASTSATVVPPSRGVTASPRLVSAASRDGHDCDTASRKTQPNPPLQVPLTRRR